MRGGVPFDGARPLRSCLDIRDEAGAGFRAAGPPASPCLREAAQRPDSIPTGAAMEKKPPTPPTKEPVTPASGHEPARPASTSLEEHERRNPGLREFLKQNPKGRIVKVVI
jgi:hypothetical protein